MSSQQRDDIIESQADIIDDLRAILAEDVPDREIVRDARLALAAWYKNTYPDRDRPQLRVIKGGKREDAPRSRQPPLMGSS